MTTRKLLFFTLSFMITTSHASTKKGERDHIGISSGGTSKKQKMVHTKGDLLKYIANADAFTEKINCQLQTPGLPPAQAELWLKLKEFVQETRQQHVITGLADDLESIHLDEKSKN